MAKAFITEVTYPDKRGTIRVTSEVGGGEMTAGQLQKHYDERQAHKFEALRPFPGATSIRVLADTEADVGPRNPDDKTPPQMPAGSTPPTEQP